jgi:penicillin-binding protein 2
MDYARQMGLGMLTGIDGGINEVPAELPVLDSVEESLMSAVGQFDVQVTPIQMARMVAGVANGGTLYETYVVQRVGGVNGETVQYEATPTPIGDMGLSPEVLDIVRTGMCMVTTNEELGTAFWVFGDSPYTVCGKTGTAQTATSYPIGWFVAYAPADNPQIAIAVVTQFSREGSETSAPIVRRILDYYFGIFPPTPFPEWWFTDTYNVLELPEGSTGG